MQNMNKPNALQRAFHRVLMLRPVTAILIKVLHHADKFLWKINGGRFSLTQALAGLPTFKITTIGAKSKLPRALPLVGLVDGDKIALIASNFGQARHPAWYHNLKANPQCQARVNGMDRTYLAREAEGQERKKYWELAVAYYAGYDVYRTRAGKRQIPIMVLEIKK